MAQRTLILAVLAMIAGVGCNAGTSNNQVRQPAQLSKEALSKTHIIAQINKNAEAIKSLEAEPSIVVSTGGESHNLRGRMRMEREKDFRLLISATAFKQSVADIGSNDKGFWFWVKDQDRKGNNIYACDYEHVSSSRLSVTMQPDWIMEAMGLRQISPREAAIIDSRPGDAPGQILLTLFRKEPNGLTYTKETLVNESTGAIIEHRLYSGAKKELLAKATINSNKQIGIPSTTGDGTETKVLIPDRFVLDWVAEKFKLEIVMGSETQVNPVFTKAQAASLFTEPTIAGANRVDLAAVNQGQANASSFIHETMPRSGIRLGQPQAVPSEEKATTRSTRPAPSLAPVSDPNALPDLPSETAVIGPQVPQGAATDPAAVQSSYRGAWRPVYEN